MVSEHLSLSLSQPYTLILTTPMTISYLCHPSWRWPSSQKQNSCVQIMPYFGVLIENLFNPVLLTMPATHMRIWLPVVGTHCCLPSTLYAHKFLGWQAAFGCMERKLASAFLFDSHKVHKCLFYRKNITYRGHYQTKQEDRIICKWMCVIDDMYLQLGSKNLVSS